MQYLHVLLAKYHPSPLTELTKYWSKWSSKIKHTSNMLYVEVLTHGELSRNDKIHLNKMHLLFLSKTLLKCVYRLLHSM
jgi:hypothetical protein